LKSPERQWERIAEEVKETRDSSSNKSGLARRRTSFADAALIEVDLEQAMIEKEPITVILSEKGWIRALKGHLEDMAKLEFKQGDGLRRAVKASTTDKILILATNGKFFTLAADQLPGGRGHGEPLRLMVDLEENHEFAEMFVHQPGRKLLLAATSGHGFIVPEDEVVAMTRKGKQVLNQGSRQAVAAFPATVTCGRVRWRKPQDAGLPIG
jgi:topoisomerase-4 subunit A